MFKFLRKYSKWLLAIFGTLLMIMFLVPQAISGFAERAARQSVIWATVGADDEKVGSDELNQARDDLELYKRLGLSVGPFGLLEEPPHWYLLVREAEASGLIGGRGSDQFVAADRQALLSMPGLTLNRRVEDSLARWHGVRRLMSMYVGANELSDRRMRAETERLFYRVDGRMVVLEGKDRPDIPVSEDAIQAQFDTYADVEPGAGEHGFGYRLPHRFRLETLVVTDAAIRALVESGDGLSAIALFEHWEENPGRNPQFPTLPAGGDIPEIPEIVRTDLLEMLVAERRSEIEKFINRRLHETRSLLRHGLDGYLVLPEDWSDRQLGLEVLASDIQAEFGIELPRYLSLGDRWLQIDDLAADEDLRELATASTARFGTRTSARDLIAGLKEFDPNPLFGTQATIALPTLDGTDGGIVLARVTEVDPARPPHAVDEVRDQIVSDLRRLADFERLTTESDAILAAAREQGLLAVALDRTTTVSNQTRIFRYDVSSVQSFLQAGYPILDLPAVLPVIGSDKPTIDAVIAHALTLPRTRPLSELPVDDRIILVTAEEKLALVLVELTTQSPLTVETYESFAPSPQLAALIQQEQFGDLAADMRDAFAFETLSERHHFKMKRRDEDTETDADGAETPAEDAQARAE